jgi:hypothetical protein
LPQGNRHNRDLPEVDAGPIVKRHRRQLGILSKRGLRAAQRGNHGSERGRNTHDPDPNPKLPDPRSEPWFPLLRICHKAQPFHRPERARASVRSEERARRPDARLGSWSWLCPIHQRTISAGLGCFGHARGLHAVGAKNVEHGLPRRDQVIRNDAPVAAPPHCFGAHDGTTPLVS